MLETSNNDWGMYGCSAALVGVTGIFTPGFSALFVGLLAIVLGFLGGKKRQKLSQTGILLGGIVVLYANIVLMGIIPMHRYVHSDKTHFINSLHGSIAAFNAMKDEDKRDSDHNKLLKHLRYSLEEAGKVDIESVDSQVKGFSSYYKDKFIKGTQFFLGGVENNDVSMKLKGGVLLDEWGIWSRENHDNLKKIKEPGSLSLFSFCLKIIS